MLKKAPALILMVAVLAMLFAVGLGYLLRIRFERGDVYPPYSTLRADPLGARAFLESLERIDGLDVRRNIRPLTRLEGGPETTLLLLGLDAEALRRADKHEVETIEAFMRRGGRVVISCFPQNQKPFLARIRAQQPAGAPPGRRDDSEPAGMFVAPVSAYERWGFDLDYGKLALGPSRTYEPVEAVHLGAGSLPAIVLWRSAIHFTDLDEEWRVVYSWEDRPVLIERPFGKGSLVVSGDSYFVSNEALRNERLPDLLAWLPGGGGRIIFNETHLGIAETPGIAGLMRTYQLHAVVAGFLLLAALFIWKNSVYFIPPHPATVDGGVEWVEGKDSTAGFINLIRRGIPARDLLNTCVAEWKKTFAHTKTRESARLPRVEELLDSENQKPPRERSPVDAYRAISRILSQRTDHERKS